MIVACYHPLPLSASMLHFDLDSILFGTSILQHFSENVFTLCHLVYTYFPCMSTGVFIDYYGGEVESHIVQLQYAAQLYFVCKAGTSLECPVLEHLKDSYTAHIHFYTEHVC